MAPGRVLLLLTVAALSVAAEQRVVHRLVGGHLRAPPHHRGRPLDGDDDAQEMVEASASGSKEKGAKRAGEDEEKKTLSQQVAEGKYGLIQKELFSRPPKRPGIVSYDDNHEVPKDNRHSLGGLSKNEIWLAENHLLVLRGGIYPPHDEKENAAGQLWPPIDDYHAPLHQVKIPKNPKVPPPFPVQLGEGAPLQVIGADAEGAFDGAPPSPADALPAAWLPPPQDGGQEAPHTPDTHKANTTAGAAALPVPGTPAQGRPPGGPAGGLPFPPSFSLNGTWPPYFASLPPGAAFLPPPNGSQSEIIDEDDPSIYYPPPYSFYYPVDNSSKVPPGPLVPGIVLPPPPEFFAPLEETTTKKSRQRKPTTPTTTQIRPTTTRIPPTTKPKKKIVKPPPTRYVPKIVKTTTTTTTTTTETPTVITVLPVVTTTLTRKYLPQSNRTYLPQRTLMPRKKPAVTILRPIKTTTAAPKVYSYENNENDKPYAYYQPPRAKTVVSTTPVPLKYYTTGNEIESNSVTDVPEKFAIGIRVKSTSKSPAAQYFYYEEGTANNLGTTNKPPVPQQQPYFNEEDYFAPPKRPPPVRKPQTQYIYVTTRPRNTQKPRYRLVPQKTDSFSVHIANLQKQIHQYYTTRGTTRRPSPKPLYQYSFEAANFRPSPQLDNADAFRPVPKYSVQIQQAIEIIPPTDQPQYQQSPTPIFQGSEYYTTPRPEYKEQKNGYSATSRPITQYSFEATPSPVYQGFYTKPDEHHFDENTKQYFTMFGRKLPTGTTPISTVEESTSRPSTPGYNEPQYENYVNPQYENAGGRYPPEQKPISLESDTIVNYVNPRPQINPDAELITPVNYPQGQRAKAVQYVGPGGSRDEDKPEIVKAVPIEVPQVDDQSGSYISYQLPGDDGAHFYFLTPQLAHSRNQGAPYYHQQGGGYRERRNQRPPSPGR